MMHVQRRTHSVMKQMIDDGVKCEVGDVKNSVQEWSASVQIF